MIQTVFIKINIDISGIKKWKFYFKLLQYLAFVLLVINGCYTKCTFKKSYFIQKLFFVKMTTKIIIQTYNASVFQSVTILIKSKTTNELII